jgi:hypothetical protein
MTRRQWIIICEAVMLSKDAADVDPREPIQNWLWCLRKSLRLGEIGPARRATRNLLLQIVMIHIRTDARTAKKVRTRKQRHFAFLTEVEAYTTNEFSMKLRILQLCYVRSAWNLNHAALW